jgi:hypothetical protein
MEILHIITSLGTGGAEVLLKDLVLIFAQKRNNVSILVFMRVDGFLATLITHRGVNITYAPANKKISLRNLFFLWKYLRKNRPNVVHTHLTWDAYALAIVGCFLNYKPVFITTEHSTVKRRRENILIRLFNLERWMYSKYRRIICISHEVVYAFLSQLPSLRSKCILISNGVNLEKFAAEYLPEKRLQRPVIMNIGKLCKHKQQAVLIRAMTKLPSIVELWLVGGGSDRYELEQLARKCGVNERVRFLGLCVDIASLIKEATIYVQASLYEGLSIAMLEALASGLPIVGSNVPGTRELIDSVGEFFEAGDWEGLATILENLLSDHEKLQQMSNASKNKALKFSIEETAASYLQMYSCEIKES